MSDQQDKNNEEQAKDNAVLEDSSTVSAGQESKDQEKEGAATAQPVTSLAEPPAKSSGGGSSAPGWIALLLVLALGAGAVWIMREQQQKEAGIASRLQAIESAASQEVTSADLATLNTQLQAQLQAQLNDALAKIRAGAAEKEAALGQQSGQLSQTVKNLESQLAQQQSELARYSANDRESWLLAEVQYLLRLANQRLVMGEDADAAQALLKSADEILRDLDDVNLHQVRAAVASDLAAVRAIPEVDVEGTYLRLSALIEQAAELKIFQLPEQKVTPQGESSDSWRDRLRRGWAAAMAKVSDYIIIRRRDVPMQALMDPQWEGLVRQNLRMLLQQAQVSLLSGNEALYRESLLRAQHWVAEFFESDEAAAKAMAGEITQLESVDVAVSLPDISNAVSALDAVMKERLQSGGAK